MLYCGKLCEMLVRLLCLCCIEYIFIVESEYGGGNFGNFCFQYYFVFGDYCVMVWGWYWLELVDNNFVVFAVWVIVLCVILCVCNYFFLFFLYGVGF